MIRQSVLLTLACVSVACAGLLPAATYSTVPVVKQVVPIREEPVDSYPRYAYSYSVSDAVHGDIKTQEESRDGSNVQGSYTVVEPDGTLRRVTYTAGIDGFNAIVDRQAGFAPPAPVFVPQQTVVQPVNQIQFRPRPIFAPQPQPVVQQPVFVQQPARPVFVQQPRPIAVQQQRPIFVQPQPQPPRPVAIQQQPTFPRPIQVQPPPQRPIFDEPAQPAPVQQDPLPVPVQDDSDADVIVGDEPQFPPQQPQPFPVQPQPQPQPAPVQQQVRPRPPQQQPADIDDAIVIEGRRADSRSSGPSSFTYSSKGKHYDYRIAY